MCTDDQTQTDKKAEGYSLGLCRHTFEYINDAYGVPTTRYVGITDSLSDAEKQEIYILGSNNPFRYRGYYYDAETGFYYLNSRYYDPTTGRFLNADSVVSGTGDSVQGYNLFAYCGNNPINRADPSGQWWFDKIEEICKKVKLLVISVFEIITDIVSIRSNEQLSQEQQDHNAKLIYNYLSFNGWSHNAICATLGNMATESYMSPGKYQDYGGGGFGLVQWDPASQYKKWAKENGYNSTSLVGQLKFLMFDIAPKVQNSWFNRSAYSEYYMPSAEFIVSNQSVEYLTQVFLHSYERADIDHLDKRLNAAAYYDRYFR